MASNTARDNLGVVAAVALLVTFLGFVGIEGRSDTAGVILLIVGAAALVIIAITALVTLVVRSGRSSA